MEDKEFINREMEFDDALSDYVSACSDFGLDVADRIVDLLMQYGIEL